MAALMQHSSGSPPANGASSVSRIPFPQAPEDFPRDQRVSFSKLEQKWILEDDDSSEWEYDEARQRWIPLLDESLQEQQGQAYAIAGVDENEPAQQPKKRKQEYRNDDEDNNIIKKQKKQKAASNVSERKNTAVYVTSLPSDTDVEEVQRIFAGCGVIGEDDDGNPRIKLYTGEDGKLKGDALIIYFRPESVQLAVQMLDDTDFRLGEASPAGKLTVKAADFSYKKEKDKPAPGPKSAMNQKKFQKKTQRMISKLSDWDDDDPSAIQATSSRWDKVVILEHMFTLQELKEDPAAILDIKADIREECEKLGHITNVVLFDKEEAGIASVRYDNEEAAKACVRLMDGRMFSGEKVVAYIAAGNERFKRSKKNDDEEDGAVEEGERLEGFGNWLEEDPTES